MGEAFFADLRGLRGRGGAAAIATVPADPIAKSVARHGRRDGSAHVEAEDHAQYAAYLTRPATQ